MEIITNNVPRDIIYGYELSEKEQKEFDYLDFSTDDVSCRDFVRYKGELIDLHEFMAFSQEYVQMAARDSRFNEWSGYQSDTFFSGILVRYLEDDSERVIVGRYYS